VIRENATIPINSSNAMDIISVKTPKQAFEYLYYFVYRSDSSSGVRTISNVWELSAEIDCTIITSSPVHSIMITKTSDASLVVELNVFDAHSGSADYHKWKFGSGNESPELISDVKLAQCTNTA
jgi:hypothetical protein